MRSLLDKIGFVRCLALTIAAMSFVLWAAVASANSAGSYGGYGGAGAVRFFRAPRVLYVPVPVRQECPQQQLAPAPQHQDCPSQQGYYAPQNQAEFYYADSFQREYVPVERSFAPVPIPRYDLPPRGFAVDYYAPQERLLLPGKRGRVDVYAGRGAVVGGAVAVSAQGGVAVDVADGGKGRFRFRPRLQKAANIGASAALGVPARAVR